MIVILVGLKWFIVRLWHKMPQNCLSLYNIIIRRKQYTTLVIIVKELT